MCPCLEEASKILQDLMQGCIPSHCKMQPMSQCCIGAGKLGRIGPWEAEIPSWPAGWNQTAPVEFLPVLGTGEDFAQFQRQGS